MYKNRFLEQIIPGLAQYFKVILITGARQVGKSTLLKNLFPDYPNFTLSPYDKSGPIVTNPKEFLDTLQGPVIFDEFQFFPELTTYLKLRVDQSDQRGQYFLTGSQNIAMLKTVAETMTGRVGIINLDGLSLHEAMKPSYCKTPNQSAWLRSYLEDPEAISYHATKTLASPSLYECIWRGSFPESLLPTSSEYRSMFFSSYIQTYIERDIRLIYSPEDLRSFRAFLGLCAALTGQEVNFSHLGRELGFTPKTTKHWLSILMQTYQWTDVFPYFGKTIKRITKRPKGHFSDTGLACFLQDIHSPLSLISHPSLGGLYETWVFQSIKQQFPTLQGAPSTYHWRTNNGTEVDIILSYNGKLYPIEMKISSSVSSHDTRGIQAFKQTYPSENIAHGLIIYGGDQCFKINEHATALPWNACLASASINEE